MFKIKIADFIVQINNKYDFLEAFCKDYITDEENVDFTVFCTDDDIEKEREISEGDFSNGYIESICIYRKICLLLPEYDSFVMHGAVIEVDNKSYAFLARSGTGKSTHIKLWHSLLGERVRVINGDKPILRYINNELWVYGTPWCGKEGWNTNAKSKLKALCFLERAQENSIKELSSGDSATRIMKQILMPKDAIGAIKTLELVDKMIADTKTWLLGCNISKEAAKIAYEAMSKE